MEYYSVIKCNEEPLRAMTWMNLENIVLSEGSQTKDQILYDCAFCEISRIGISIETEGLVVAKELGE